MGQKFRLGLGTKHITLDAETGDIEFEAGVLSLTQWQGLHKRVTEVLTKEKLIPVVKQDVRSHGGPVEPAPWFLRPWYTKVQPKERSYVND